MPFWTILKITHRPTSARTLTTIIMTARTYIVNKEQKNNSQGSRQEHIQKISNGARIDNDDIQKGENIVKTRYGRTVRKPDRLMYQ